MSTSSAQVKTLRFWAIKFKHPLEYFMNNHDWITKILDTITAGAHLAPLVTTRGFPPNSHLYGPNKTLTKLSLFWFFVISWKIRTRRIQVPEQQKHKLLRRAQIRRVVDVLNEVLVCLLWHVFGARTHKFTNRIQPTVDGRNPANQLIGSLSHCSHSHIPGGDRQISEASTVSTPKSLPCRCIFHQ